MNVFEAVAGAIGGLFKGAESLIDELHTSPEEKAEMKLKMKKLELEAHNQISLTMQKENEVKRDVMVAELQQGDSFTKRARPMFIYAMTGLIVANYFILPLLKMPPIELPEQMWNLMTIAFSVYAIGRTFEKTGVAGKLTKKIMG